MTNLFYIGNSWDGLLKDEFCADYCQNILSSLDVEYLKHKVYPQKDMIFAALKAVDYTDVRVCILGQDPYHGAGQANGMAFAVHRGVPFPPSLLNIFKELKSDLGISIPKNGTLTGWAKQGVLLLNASLTVREGQPLSHAGLGWGKLTDSVIRLLSARETPIVFILWGASANAKSPLIAPQHKIISSVHPSPLSASRGFFGSKPFSKANNFLIECGQKPIDWGQINDGDNDNKESKTYNQSDNKPAKDNQKPESDNGRTQTIDDKTIENKRASYYAGAKNITVI